MSSPGRLTRMVLIPLEPNSSANALPRPLLAPVTIANFFIYLLLIQEANLLPRLHRQTLRNSDALDMRRKLTLGNLIKLR